jgi:hypothetical protein
VLSPLIFQSSILPELAPFHVGRLPRLHWAGPSAALDEAIKSGMMLAYC